jgi:hypothetical protein
VAGLTKDTGVLAALVTRFESQRLPRLLELREKVDGGHPLDEAELDFLQQVQKDASSAAPLIAQHPEYQDLFSRAVQLYSEIIATAMKNEAALLVRFEAQRLPRLIEIKEKVDGGHSLDEAELDFLQQVQKDASYAAPLIAQHAEYQELFSRAVQLYSEIIARAQKNKQGS